MIYNLDSYKITGMTFLENGSFFFKLKLGQNYVIVCALAGLVFERFKTWDVFSNLGFMCKHKIRVTSVI